MNANHFKQRIACRYFRAPQKLYWLALSFSNAFKICQISGTLASTEISDANAQTLQKAAESLSKHQLGGRFNRINHERR